MDALTLKRCLVTGAAGFIGSHLVEQLRRDGFEVRALVRYTSDGRAGWLDDLDSDLRSAVEIVRGDVRDPDQMRRLVAGCDGVFHLAALIGIPYSYDAPRQNVEVNALGTLNLLEAARLAGVRRFVHTSSSEVYGSAQYVPIDERHPLVGQSPYSASKIAADQLVTSFVSSFEFPAVTVRPFNTYGPRQSMRAVIPTIVAQCLWGETVRLGSLDTRRDLTFVADTAAGMIAAGTRPGVDGETFNLGHGEDIAIGDLAALVLELVDRDVPVEQDPARVRPPVSEVKRLLSDPSKARTALGWRPGTSLRDGLEATIEWMQAHGVRRAIEEFVV